MRSADQDLLDRWLSAEQNDRADEADAALAALFTALPPCCRRPVSPTG